MSALGTVESTPAVALGNSSYAAIELAGLPTKFRGGLVALVLTDIVTATSVTWYLSADEAGNQPISPIRSADAIVGAGGVANNLENAAMACWETLGSIWIQAKVNAGSANAVGRFAWGS